MHFNTEVERSLLKARGHFHAVIKLFLLQGRGQHPNGGLFLAFNGKFYEYLFVTELV